MNKTICALVVFSFAFSLLLADSSAQQQRYLPPTESKAGPPIRVGVVATAEDDDAREIGRLPQLRSEFLRLIQQRVELMDEKDLAAEIARIKKTQSDMIARQKLKLAQRLLNELAKSHSDSPAAATARRMLRTVDADGPFDDAAETANPAIRLRRNIESLETFPDDEPEDIRRKDTRREDTRREDTSRKDTRNEEPRRVIDNPFGDGQGGPKPALRPKPVLRPERTGGDPFGDDG